MKLILISDTHNAQIDVPDGNVLIHAGDLTGRGTVAEMGDTMTWLSELPHEYKVVIAGNHDFFAEEYPDVIARWMEQKGLIYLHDSGFTIHGVKFWGSPYQPWFHDWAFNRWPHELKQHWDLIPDDTDVLITHGPPKFVLDRTVRGEEVGCGHLREALDRVRPRIHVFGHIHEDYGHTQLFNLETRFYNASIMNLQYRPVNKPFVVDYEM